ncbi:MAG: FecR domain-containing protein, partial [Verrucomicrobiota bacterium]
MNRSELTTLIGAALNGTATAEERERLETRLAADPEARQLYLRYINVHASLRKYGAANTIPFPKPVPRSRRLALAAGLILFLVAGLIAALYFFGGPRTGPYQPPFLATVTESVATRFEVGAELPAGELEVPDGYLKLSMSHGADVLLEGPARIDLKRVNDLALLGGRLTARIPETAVGFQVRTPEADIIDLGTAFGVLVDADQGTLLQVVEGRVKAVPQAEIEPRIFLDGSEVKLTAENGFEPLLFNTNRFVHDLSGDAAADEAWPAASQVGGHEVLQVRRASEPVVCDGALTEWRGGFTGMTMDP